MAGKVERLTRQAMGSAGSNPAPCQPLSTYRLLQMLPDAREDSRPEVLEALLAEIGVDAEQLRNGSRKGGWCGFKRTSGNPMRLDYYNADTLEELPPEEVDEERRDARRAAARRQSDASYWLRWESKPTTTTTLGDFFYSELVQGALDLYANTNDTQFASFIGSVPTAGADLTIENLLEAQQRIRGYSYSEAAADEPADS